MHTKFVIDTQITDAGGIAEVQDLVAAGDLVLDGAWIVGGIFDVRITYSGVGASQIIVGSDDDVSGVLFTVHGTDIFGNPMTESINGINANSVTTNEYFQTVTRISADDAATNVYAGSDGSGNVYSPIIALNDRSATGPTVYTSTELDFGLIMGPLNSNPSIYFSGYSVDGIEYIESLINCTGVVFSVGSGSGPYTVEISQRDYSY